MKFLRKLIDLSKAKVPDYFGEFVTGDLNGYVYEGTVIEQRGEGLYLIETPEGHKHLVHNIRRKGDLICRRQ